MRIERILDEGWRLVVFKVDEVDRRRSGLVSGEITGIEDRAAIERWGIVHLIVRIPHRCTIRSHRVHTIGPLQAFRLRIERRHSTPFLIRRMARLRKFLLKEMIVKANKRFEGVWQRKGLLFQGSVCGVDEHGCRLAPTAFPFDNFPRDLLRRMVSIYI